MSIGNPFEKRRQDISRINSMTVKVHHVAGFIAVNGAGEVAQDVKFPVWFVEKPSFYFGGELDAGQSPVATNFPTISVMVLRWEVTQRGLVNYYTGATLGVVTTGAADHQVIVHWHMEAKALRNPLSSNELGTL